MSSIDLNQLSPAELQHLLERHRSIVACLCAAWCDVCTSYRQRFNALAEQHPDVLFLWIDIEDQAALVGDLDVDNFPTLLIQHDAVVSFYGTMQPDTNQLKRMLQSQLDQTTEQRQAAAHAAVAQRVWQTEANLRARFSQLVQ